MIGQGNIDLNETTPGVNGGVETEIIFKYYSFLACAQVIFNTANRRFQLAKTLLMDRQSASLTYINFDKISRIEKCAPQTNSSAAP